MNFFKSVFSDDQDQHSDPQASPESPEPSSNSPNPNSNLPSITNAWSFGTTLMKTIASRSESVIETYRRDLEEFGSGLKKETAVIHQAASRAVKDLPTAAQDRLESVGQVFDNLGNTVTEIINHGKESIFIDDSDSEMLSDTKSITSSSQLDLSSRPYSRLDVQIRSIQSDMNTYCEEPEDLVEYNEWKLGFVLDERVEEVEDLGVIEEIYNEIVPVKVDRETFWMRYFYRVYKVKKAEEARSKLVNRVISGDQEEELSWDVDEDDYEQSGGDKLKGDLKEQVEEMEKKKSVIETEEDLKNGNVIDEKGVVFESKSNSEGDQIGNLENKLDEAESSTQIGSLERKLDEPESTVDNLGVKSDDKMTLEGKNDNGGSCKDSDFSVVSSQHSPEEEDLGWDEIEDMGSDDENKVDARGSPSRADLHRRLIAPDEEEDLTWDIEDDDEPIRS
ncbi:hypothetical protein LguiA_001181 [Lonicera macranthoides]